MKFDADKFLNDIIPAIKSSTDSLEKTNNDLKGINVVDDELSDITITINQVMEGIDTTTNDLTDIFDECVYKIIEANDAEAKIESIIELLNICYGGVLTEEEINKHINTILEKQGINGEKFDGEVYLYAGSSKDVDYYYYYDSEQNKFYLLKDGEGNANTKYVLEEISNKNTDKVTLIYLEPYGTCSYRTITKDDYDKKINEKVEEDLMGLFFDHYYRTETGECVDADEFFEKIIKEGTKDFRTAKELEKFISIEIFGIEGTFNNGTGEFINEIFENLPSTWKPTRITDRDGNTIENSHGIPNVLYPTKFQCTWFVMCVLNTCLYMCGKDFTDTGITHICNGGNMYSEYKENKGIFEANSTTPQNLALGSVKGAGGHSTHVFVVTGVTYDEEGNVEGMYVAECGNGKHWMGVNYYDKDFIDQCTGFLCLNNATKEELLLSEVSFSELKEDKKN